MDLNVIIVYGACLIVLFIIGRVFYLPLKHIFKLLINSVLGGFLIYIVNVVGSSFGFHIGLNFWTAGFTGMLGVPGVVLLVLIKILLGN
jgi:inhibitor of the pro-sigma K processing machinery